jgi:pyruvate formate lyase activating enzyme
VKESPSTGTIIKIERFAIHDGPGIRTAVFMKGCPLRCAWCSNPESQLPEIETFHKPEYEPVGRKASAAEIVDVVLRDRQYYAASGGGVTLTGGEPLFQPAFAHEILKACREENIHTAMETSGFAPWEDWEMVLPALDLVCYDLKIPDPAAHARLTGVDNRVILDNLRRIARLGIPVTIRIPLIPLYNDSPEALDGFALIMQSMGLKTVHLLPYHRMGMNKYGWLGRPYDLSELKTHTDAQLSGILERFTQKGFAAHIGG